jgi:WD40 repeat protein
MHVREKAASLRPFNRSLFKSFTVEVHPPKRIRYEVELETQVNDIKFSNDDQIIAAACNDRTVKFYDAKTGGLEHTFDGCLEHVSSIDLSQTLLVAGSSAAYVWSLDDKQLRHTMTGHTRQIYAVGISDVRLITGSCDRTVKIWELNHVSASIQIDSFCRVLA